MVHGLGISIRFRSYRAVHLRLGCLFLRIDIRNRIRDFIPFFGFRYHTSYRAYTYLHVVL